MKLYLHIGTEKTGSSLIQTLCVKNREQLSQAGIWFPKGIPLHEKRMRRGLVSAGNAVTISQLTHDAEDSKLLNELVSHRQKAQFRKCDSVLLSSELLLPYCAQDGAWRRLYDNIERAKFEAVSVLVILRDPVEQLISLYKHRAKTGTVASLAHWVEHGYCLPSQLSQMRRQLGSEIINLVARRYTRDSGGLERIFFEDWLHTNVPQFSTKKEVNASLSLSEIELIRRLNDHRPSLVPLMFKRLSSVPRDQKAQGHALEGYCRAIAEATVLKSRAEWRQWSQMLPAGEDLVLPQHSPEIPDRPTEVDFSSQQLDALVDLISNSATLSFLTRVIWESRVRPFLGQLWKFVARPRIGRA